jgi:phage terminase large subunit
VSALEIPTPRKFVPLLRPARYKGAHGGRGSGKSHFFAELLVERCLMEPGLRAVCIREIQKSLNQSVKRLIEDKIAALGVGSRFGVQESVIRTPGNGLILFQGMQNHTADSIKSLQGYKIAWGEEAQSLSKRSLKLLTPTIREPGSELWFSWNPESSEDPVDEMFRGKERITGDDVVCVEANWRDNPWFPAELERDRQRDFTRDPDGYGHVWEGGYVTVSDAIIFRRRVVVEEFGDPPEGTQLRFGADWGFSQDPTTLVRCWIRGSGDDAELMVDYEAGGIGVELDETAALFDEVPGSRDWPIWADSARPETISYVRRQGFAIDAAEKWQGSVEDGIAHLKAFKRIVVHPRCVETAREFRLYAYKVDRLTGKVLPIIVDQFNHRIDALRYALNGFIQRRGAAGIWSRLV